MSFGLSGSLAEEWAARPQRLAAALAALMGSKLWDRVEKKLTCLRAITGEPNVDRRFLLNKVIDEAQQLKGEERASDWIQLSRLGDFHLRRRDVATARAC